MAARDKLPPVRRGDPVSATEWNTMRDLVIRHNVGPGQYADSQGVYQRSMPVEQPIEILVMLTGGPDFDNLYTATPAVASDFNTIAAEEGATDIKVGFPNVSGTLPGAENTEPANGVSKIVRFEGTNESGDVIYHCYDVSIPRRQYGETPGNICT